MPIDIALGIVHLEYEDAAVQGNVDLVWDRRYSTALLEQSAALLGRGWTCRYFATLTKRNDGFEFVTAQGALEVFADPHGRVDQGETVRNFGAFLEVFRQDHCYIVQHWNVETCEIVRYCFHIGLPGESWPLESIEDATGQALDVIWDQHGRLATVQQRLKKRALTLGYNAAGFIDRVVLRAQHGEQSLVARYEYDAGGRQITAYDAAECADRYEYDANDRLIRESLKDGGVFTYRYDNKGRCIKTSGLDRYQEKRLRFLDASRFTEVTDSYDRIFRYQHLPSGQMVREIDPLGNEKSTNYDDYGRVVAETDTTGAVTGYTYDDYGNRATITDALGHTKTFTYNEHHLPLSMTDALGQLWYRTYDHANRLTGAMDPLGHWWRIRYDAEGNVAEVENPSGACRRLQYTQGMLNTATDWVGNVTRFRLDLFGRITERQAPSGETTHFTYDRLGNPIEVRLPNGATVCAGYDNVSNLTSFIDGNGYVTRFRYGPCRRLLERIDPVGGVMHYVWGSEPGRLEQVVNEKGETYRFFRDGGGRIIREQSFDGAERQFGYDAGGYVVAYTNANGETVRIQRDALHRIIGQTLPDGGSVTFKFDPLGNLVTAVNAAISVVFERDPLGRIVREVQGERWVESRYDAPGNLIRTGTSFSHSVDYEVDANGFVSKLTTLGNQILEFKRNAYGQETNRRMPGGVVMEQRYDNLGRLVEQGVGRRGWGNHGNASVIPLQGEIVRRTYTYDSNSSLTSIIDGHWGRLDYVYDPAERLLQALSEHGSSESFSYDPAGNITRIQTRDQGSTDETLVYGPGNRLLKKGSTRYEYDAEGRRIKKIEDADSDNPHVWHYEWEILGSLKSVVRPDGDIWRFKYDALGRRIIKDGPKEVRRFLWDKGVVVHEFDDKYARSSWIFDMVSFSPIASIQKSRMYAVINDHIGSPRELIDDRGNVAWARSSKAWGAETANKYKPSSVECPIRFPGQWCDDEIGLNYNRFRYYDRDIGVFITQDPLGLAGGINLYLYAKNPIRWIDPLGLCGSPDIDPKDVAGKTPAEIDALAKGKGLIPKGPDPQGGRGAYVDPVTGEQRVLIHPVDPVSGPHAHVNDPSGQRLDIGGNVVPPESPAAHLPLKFP